MMDLVKLHLLILNSNIVKLLNLFELIFSFFIYILHGQKKIL